MKSVYLGFLTYLKGTVCLGGAFVYCGQLDFPCSDLHPGDCPLGVHPAFTALNPPPGIFGHGYSLFKQFLSLPLRGCFFMYKSFFFSILSMCYPWLTKAVRISLFLSSRTHRLW